jgi:hypothetical protein
MSSLHRLLHQHLLELWKFDDNLIEALSAEQEDVALVYRCDVELVRLIQDDWHYYKQTCHARTSYKP